MVVLRKAPHSLNLNERLETELAQRDKNFIDQPNHDDQQHYLPELDPLALEKHFFLQLPPNAFVKAVAALETV
jgi:hypothetical protein